MTEYKDLSYEQTLKVLKENKDKNREIKFNLSPLKENNFRLDEPTSKGSLEEEIWGP